MRFEQPVQIAPWTTQTEILDRSFGSNDLNQAQRMNDWNDLNDS